MDNGIKCQPQCQKCKQNVFLHIMLIKQSYRIGQKSGISLVVFLQKQMLGEVGNRMVIYGKLCQEYSHQKLSKSDDRFSSYSQKCLGCFFETRCRTSSVVGRRGQLPTLNFSGCRKIVVIKFSSLKCKIWS